MASLATRMSVEPARSGADHTTRSAPVNPLAACLCEDGQLPFDEPEVGCVLVMILRRQCIPCRNTDLMAAHAAPVDTRVGRLNAGSVKKVICHEIFLLKELWYLY
jgi:hypothetical protein